jgi:glutamate-1-semialdehyde 2,1-aminomutase
VTYAEELARYEARHPKSRALFAEARRVLPGGNTRTGIFFPPFPPYLAAGSGCHVWDIDGQEYLDCLGNFTALILGYAPATVVEAATAQTARGTSFAAPTETEVALAQILTERLPSVDLVRFTNSGTEATLNALRAARAVTGRERVAKFEGAYHGTHDSVEVSIAPPAGLAGPPRRPRSVPAARGIPTRSVRDTLVLPFNDAEAVERLLGRYGPTVAAVIVEPVMASTGLILPETEFPRPPAGGDHPVRDSPGFR